MSSANVELVKRAYAAVAAADVEAGLELVHPEAEIHTYFGNVDSKVYRGLGGVREYLEDLSEVWDRFDPRPSEFIEAADKVVVPLELNVEGRGSGVEMTEQLAYVWTLRDGKIIGGQGYASTSEALEAAGIER